MLGLLLAAALAPADMQELDEKGLRKAIAEAVERGDTTALAGRRFRLIVPFASQTSRRYTSLKQSARWSYDERNDVLTTSIGLGEISAQNFSTFGANGLERLPPMQSLVFSVSAGETSVLRARDMPLLGEEAYQHGRRVRGVSFGLAVPFSGVDHSGLPRGFTPLQVSHIRAPKMLAVSLVQSLSLVVEGQIVDLGQGPSAFCGQYEGQVNAREVDQDTTLLIKDEQCFATARIDRVKVVNGRGALSVWPKAGD